MYCTTHYPKKTKLYNLREVKATVCKWVFSSKCIKELAKRAPPISFRVSIQKRQGAGTGNGLYSERPRPVRSMNMEWERRGGSQGSPTSPLPQAQSCNVTKGRGGIRTRVLT